MTLPIAKKRLKYWIIVFKQVYSKYFKEYMSHTEFCAPARTPVLLLKKQEHKSPGRSSVYMMILMFFQYIGVNGGTGWSIEVWSPQALSMSAVTIFITDAPGRKSHLLRST